MFRTHLGSEDLGLNEDDLEEDFDPDKYDKRMKEIFEVCTLLSVRQCYQL